MTRPIMERISWETTGAEDREAYRALTARCPWSTVFHAPEWLDAVAATLSPRVRLLLARSGGALVGAFPYFRLPAAGAGRLNHSCLRDDDMVYGGPLAAPVPPPVAGDATPVLHALLEAFEAGAGTVASFILPPPGFPEGVLAARGYRLTRHLTATIDLRGSEEDLWSRVHSKTRNMIRKARRCGLTVREAAPAELSVLPAMIATPYLRAGRRPPDPAWILAVASRLRDAGRARILVAVAEKDSGGGTGRLVAGALFLRHGVRSYYWAGGAVSDGYDTAASHLVQWEGIVSARAGGCVEHDLVMVDPVAAPGIARFKLRFGATVVPLVTAARRPLAGRILGRTLGAADRLAAALMGRPA